VPASLTTRAITRILEEGYDVRRLNAQFDQLLDEMELDLLFIDTHPGLNRETMLTTAISDALVILIRPDQQDYHGTAVLTEIANKLEVPHKFLVANKIFSRVDEEQLKERLQKTFGYEVIGMIPLHEDLARLESRSLITQVIPEHMISHELRSVAERLVGLP
jgi:MinD-like ATPase involved in chromosome partitioning or flagellar assembly